MRRSATSRIAAVLAGVLLFQLLLLASGTLCRMHGQHAAMADATAVGEHAAHGPMAMQPPHGAEMPEVADASAGMQSGSCDMSGSCNAPWAPGGNGCASMATCITAISAIPSSAAPSPAHLVRRLVVAAFAAMPLGPAFAPELPPPRA